MLHAACVHTYSLDKKVQLTVIWNVNEMMKPNKASNDVDFFFKVVNADLISHERFKEFMKFME